MELLSKTFFAFLFCLAPSLSPPKLIRFQGRFFARVLTSGDFMTTLCARDNMTIVTKTDPGRQVRSLHKPMDMEIAVCSEGS